MTKCYDRCQKLCIINKKLNNFCSQFVHLYQQFFGPVHAHWEKFEIKFHDLSWECSYFAGSFKLKFLGLWQKKSLFNFLVINLPKIEYKNRIKKFTKTFLQSNKIFKCLKKFWLIHLIRKKKIWNSLDHFFLYKTPYFACFVKYFWFSSWRQKWVCKKLSFICALSNCQKNPQNFIFELSLKYACSQAFCLSPLKHVKKSSDNQKWIYFTSNCS